MRNLSVKEKNDEVFGSAVVAVIYFLPIIILLFEPNRICITFFISLDWLVNVLVTFDFVIMILKYAIMIYMSD